MNTPIFEENSLDDFKGIDIMRAVRSFDPCLPCGVHMFLGKGKTLQRLHTPTQVADPTLAVLSPTTGDDGMAAQNLRVVGDRIEQLLDELQATRRPAAFDVAERAPAPRDRALRRRPRAGDDPRGRGVARGPCRGCSTTTSSPACSSCMASIRSRSRRGWSGRSSRSARSSRTHDGDVELLDVDVDVGAVHLRLLGSCDGCPSSTVTLRSAVEQAILEAAPEIVIIDVEQPATAVAEPAGIGTPVTLGRKPSPRFEQCPTGVAASRAVRDGAQPDDDRGTHER